ncbi:MAG TPA: NifB/NifX family molybdenum-iron cluster-binding protein, partial [Coriobacteriia bacterium]
MVDNSANRDALQGAGLGAAEIASEHGVAAVITGHLGPKAFSALQLAGIDGYDGTGKTVRTADRVRRVVPRLRVVLRRVPVRRDRGGAAPRGRGRRRPGGPGRRTDAGDGPARRR